MCVTSDMLMYVFNSRKLNSMCHVTSCMSSCGVLCGALMFEINVMYTDININNMYILR